MNKREKKWFKGGGPFSEINKTSSDIQTLSAMIQFGFLFDFPPFLDADILFRNKEEDKED